MINNQAKHIYFEQMKQQILDVIKNKLIPPIKILFVFFNGQKRLSDLTNYCCVVDKFFCDCLVQLGLIEDDNYENIIEVTYEYGGYDKDKQRIEIFITDNQHA